MLLSLQLVLKKITPSQISRPALIKQDPELCIVTPLAADCVKVGTKNKKNRFIYTHAHKL